MFCPKCGTLLIPKKEGNKKVMTCPRGDYSSDEFEMGKLSETVKEKKEVEVIDESETETLPLTDHICEKCGHDKAYFWLIQTRASDEPETKFLKCEKCKHTTRDYS